MLFFFFTITNPFIKLTEINVFFDVKIKCVPTFQSYIKILLIFYTCRGIRTNFFIGINEDNK